MGDRCVADNAILVRPHLARKGPSLNARLPASVTTAFTAAADSMYCARTSRASVLRWQAGSRDMLPCESPVPGQSAVR